MFRSSDRQSGWLAGASLAAWMAFAFLPDLAFAQGVQVVTPTATIYPGDLLTAGALRHSSVDGSGIDDPDIVRDFEQVVGKVARRTLLPGQAIRLHMVAFPVRVRSGSNVRVVFEDMGVSVTSTGIALQAGSVGDHIRVRNSDSGIVITGTVQGAGYVRVSGR